MIVHDLILATRRRHLTGIERFAINVFKASAATATDVIALVSPGSPLVHHDNVVTVESAASWAAVAGYLRPSDACRGLICAAFPAGPTMLLNRIPIVRVIHDAFAWTRPQNLSWQGRLMFAKWDRLALRRYAHVFAPSQIARDELVDVLPRKDIKVCGNAPGMDLTSSKMAPISQLEGKTFLLAVGTAEPRKNYERLIAFADATADGPMIVVVGRSGWGETAGRLHAAQTRMPQRFLWLQDIDDAGLRWLYRHCAAFISLSHAEGFNMPLVEAGVTGCPIVCSDIPIHAAVAPHWAVRVRDDISNEALAQALHAGTRPQTIEVEGYRVRHDWQTIAQAIEAPLRA
ncbi:glycosyltransferase [Sphingomonas sp. CV7422]|uniref:glycosyltransferase n=1 Tax=Sphingomonas sp. CV7422 TaxID=3018036 RepID=UPI0022FE91E0|nr:glycosyltransferase [Sphingomonas sp. CV7422]